MHTPHREDPEAPLTNESGEQNPTRPTQVEEENVDILGGKRTDSDPPSGSKLSDLIYILDEDVPEEDGSTRPTASIPEVEADATDDEEEGQSLGIGPLADAPIDASLLEDGVAPSPSITHQVLPNLPDDALSQHADTLVTNIEALRGGDIPFGHDNVAAAEGQDAFDGLFQNEETSSTRDGIDDGYDLDEPLPESGLSTHRHSYQEDAEYEHDRPPTAEELATDIGDESDDLYGGQGEPEEEFDEEPIAGESTFQPAGWYEEEDLLHEANLVLVSSRHKVIPWAVGLVVTAVVCFGVGGYLYQKKLDAQAVWTASESATQDEVATPTPMVAETPTAPVSTLPPLSPQQNADLGSGLGLVVAQLTALPFGATELEPTPLEPAPTPTDVQGTPPVVTVAEGAETSGGTEATTPDSARPPFDDPIFSGEFTRTVPERSPQAERSRRRILVSHGEATLSLRNNNVFRGRIYDFNDDMVSLQVDYGFVSFALDEIRHIVPRDGIQPIDIERDEPTASGRKGSIALEYFVQPRQGKGRLDIAAADSDLISAIHVNVAHALGEELAVPESGPELVEPGTVPLALPTDGEPRPDLPATPTSSETPDTSKRTSPKPGSSPEDKR